MYPSRFLTDILYVFAFFTLHLFNAYILFSFLFKFSCFVIRYIIIPYSLFKCWPFLMIFFLIFLVLYVGLISWRKSLILLSIRIDYERIDNSVSVEREDGDILINGKISPLRCILVVLFFSSNKV